MNFLNPETLYRELEAALIYFDEAEGDSDEKGVILEQISGMILMLEATKNLDIEELKIKQLEMVRDNVQNLQLVKIAETGTDFFGGITYDTKRYD